MASNYTRGPVIHEDGRASAARASTSSIGSSRSTHEHRFEALVDQLRTMRGLTLVFVRTKHGADRLVKRLAATG